MRGKIILIMPLSYLVMMNLAYGHAFPSSETPGADAVVSRGNVDVSITYNSGIEPPFSHISVVGPDRKVVSHGKSVSGSTLSTSASASTPGTYTVTWGVIATDGHHTQGSYTFKVQ